MPKTVLVPFDGSDEATRALKHALSSHGDAEITVLYVAGGASPMMGEAVGIALQDDAQEAATEQGSEVFESARKHAAEAGVDIETRVAVGKPAKSIVEHADEYDLVVLGSHSGGLKETFLTGNVTKHVVRDSPVPVTVVN
jgi:nucleotide-binding universal stress UspA family protein